MRQFQRVLTGFVASMTLVGIVSAADVIEQRGQTAKISGQVTKVTKDKVTIKPAKGDEKEIPTNEIISIDWEGEPSSLQSSRLQENNGKLTSAAEGYTKAAVDGKDASEFIKSDIEYFGVRVLAKMAITDPSKIPDALTKLGAFQTKHSDSRHYYEATGFLVDLNLAKGDAAAARSASEALAKSPGNDQKMSAKLALARISILEKKIPEAQKEFEEVAASPAAGPVEQTRVQEAKLGLAHCYQLQNKFDEAIKLLDEVIAQCPPEDSRVQAEAYVRQGDCYQGAGKNKDALLAYLHVDVLFSSEKTVHPEALFHLAKLWAIVQQPDRANEAADKLSADYPNSPWAQKLKNPTAAGG